MSGYRIDLDLDRGDDVFDSRTTVRFRCAEPGADTFVDVYPRELRVAVLNGPHSTRIVAPWIFLHIVRCGVPGAGKSIRPRRDRRQRRR